MRAGSNRAKCSPSRSKIRVGECLFGIPMRAENGPGFPLADFPELPRGTRNFAALRGAGALG